MPRHMFWMGETHELSLRRMLKAHRDVDRETELVEALVDERLKVVAKAQTIDFDDDGMLARNRRGVKSFRLDADDDVRDDRDTYGEGGICQIKGFGGPPR